MQKVECRMTSCSFANGCKYRDQFIGLFEKQVQARRYDNVLVREQLQPIKGLIRFPEAIAYLRNEFSFRTRAVCLTVIGAD